MDAKPGWKTTEFWTTIGAMALANFGPIAQQMADTAGPKTSAVATAVLAGLYTIGRAWVKK